MAKHIELARPVSEQSVTFPPLMKERLGSTLSGRLIYYPNPLPYPEKLPITRTVSNVFVCEHECITFIPNMCIYSILREVFFTLSSNVFVCEHECITFITNMLLKFFCARAVSVDTVHWQSL